ncbi:MAG: nicotinate-nucleotide--dimethylbenzimidazole phosphoribosyltransferase [Lautropia sp. SCN 69-89]|nr:MAG: nicotinate-nucleotide--dimethylbenzimidazole phosphoribosyltransferase [Lautropia sp. SCN 69-89]
MSLPAPNPVPALRLPTVAPLADSALEARLQHLIDRKTKPTGALGRIERLALQIGLILRSERPVLDAPQMLVFAADHGIAAQGVSAYPQEVTWQMVENMLAGGAAINVFSRQMGLALTLVDAGVAHDFAPRAGLVTRKIAHGTRDASVEPAMTTDECIRALEAGRELVRALPGNAVLFGEMGIANTSSAALLLAKFAGVPLSAAVGRGTGLDDAGLARKREVLERALARHAGATEPLDVLAALGGFEIAMMAGAMLQAASERRVVVVDGFITGAAQLAARALAPQVHDYCVFSHLGAEHGHAALIGALKAEPLLAMGLRLGEGSGAALAWPLVDAAARMLAEMASFESAGVADRDA